MKIQQKPDYLIFAEGSKSGELSDFPDISRGWGITLEQTQAKPPLEWMNSAFNRIDKNTLYLLQQGVPEWSESVLYPISAIIKVDGTLYEAKTQNTNLNPINSPNDWQLVVRFQDATTKQKGIVQLSSATDSESETQSATPKAVKTAYDLAKKANDKDYTFNGGTVTGDTNFTGGLKANNSDVITESTLPNLFENQLTDSGYQKLPNGLIIQWGNNFTPTGYSVTLPITYPNKSLLILATNADKQGSGVDNAFGYFLNNSTIYIGLKGSNGNLGSGFKVSYLAIGY